MSLLFTCGIILCTIGGCSPGDNYSEFAEDQLSLETRGPENLQSHKLQSQEEVYILELDLFNAAKQQELNALIAEREVLFAKVKTGDKEAEMALQEISGRIKQLENNLQETLAQSNQYHNDWTMRIRPLPPCPVNKCGIGQDNSLLVANNIKELRATILDKNKNTIGILESQSHFTDAKTGLRAHRFKMSSSYKGLVTIQVERITTNGLKEQYHVLREIK